MLKKLLAFTFLTLSISANAAVIEVGDLNIIDDAGNASDGLRFLDMSYSDGKTLAAALTGAQASYANARLATATEWDDLFAAAGIGYNGAETASDAFTAGSGKEISSGGVYDAGALSAQLGYTAGTVTFIWSDPDGSTNVNGTRDYISLDAVEAYIGHATGVQNRELLGYLIVSDVPIPAAAWLFGSALLGLGALKRRKA